MQHRSRFGRRLCVAVDLEGYGGRDNVEQDDAQSELSDVLDEAAAAVDLDRSAWERQEQGDGELALIPPDQPEPLVIDDLTRELAAILRLRNHKRTSNGRLRLRVAICFGVAYQARFGFAGQGVVATARLLASEELHRALTDNTYSDLAVALSADVFQTVEARHTSLSTDEFTKVQVHEKEYIADAWIRVFRGNKISHEGPVPPNDSAAPESSKESPRSANTSSGSPTMHNTFKGPVDVGVIGWNLGSVKRSRK